MRARGLHDPGRGEQSSEVFRGEIRAALARPPRARGVLRVVVAPRSGVGGGGRAEKGADRSPPLGAARARRATRAGDGDSTRHLRDGCATRPGDGRAGRGRARARARAREGHGCRRVVKVRRSEPGKSEASCACAARGVLSPRDGDFAEKVKKSHRSPRGGSDAAYRRDRGSVLESSRARDLRFSRVADSDASARNRLGRRANRERFSALTGTNDWSVWVFFHGFFGVHAQTRCGGHPRTPPLSPGRSRGRVDTHPLHSSHDVRARHRRVARRRTARVARKKRCRPPAWPFLPRFLPPGREPRRPSDARLRARRVRGDDRR